jgi:GNAT superfamily N-acetyltransferase
MEAITFRPAADGDLEFLWRLHTATMREYVDQTWGWDDAFQQRRFRETFLADRGGLEIIEAGGHPIGCLRVVRELERWFLAAIEIAPSHQRKGVGSAIITGLCQEADAAGLPVDLRVLKVNPAIELYRRLGFAVTGAIETHFMMRRQPFGRPLA